jgi:hypothetical protein
VVVELKAVPFEPEFVGKLNMYMGAVDDLLRHPDDKPTIGLLLCKGKDRIVAEYALSGFTRPIGVADWKKQLTEKVPAELMGSLPSVEEIEAELRTVVEQTGKRTRRGPSGGTVREAHAPYGAERVLVVDRPFDAADGADTPFGRRWEGGTITLTAEHLAALKNGKTLALDIRDEYVTFVKAAQVPERAQTWRVSGEDLSGARLPLWSMASRYVITVRNPDDTVFTAQMVRLAGIKSRFVRIRASS